jgi:hypothetical protein
VRGVDGSGIPDCPNGVRGSHLAIFPDIGTHSSGWLVLNARPSNVLRYRWWWLRPQFRDERGQVVAFDIALAFLDPLLARAALVVERGHALGRAAHVRHDEADARIKFFGMPLDLGNHPARLAPAQPASGSTISRRCGKALCIFLTLKDTLREGSDKRRFFAVLHQPPIASPVDAVRAAIVGNRG